MLRIALRALRSRRTQTVTLVLLSALVTAAAVAAPFFVYASTEQLTVRDLASASSAERQVSIAHQVSVKGLGAAGLQSDMDDISRKLELASFTGVTSVRTVGTAGPPTGPSVAQIGVRTDICRHVVVNGTCVDGSGAGPSGGEPADAMVSAATAKVLEVRLGDTVVFTSPSLKQPLKLHVAGLYQPRDANDPYWGQTMLAAQLEQNAQIGDRVTDTMFTSLATIVASGTTTAFVERDLAVGAHTMSVATSINLTNQINDAITKLRPAGYTVASDFGDLSTRIVLDTNLIFTSVPLGAAEIVIFGWFALFLSIRATAVARRFDVGILKLRGVQRRGLWTLMTEQSLIPLLAGVPFGLIAGFVGARYYVGGVHASGDIVLATLAATGAALLAILGGLVAALIAERQALATPVGDLLRSTPPRRRGWRADIADLILVVLAIGGVIQIRTSSHSDGPSLTVLAPALIAFAIGLLTARLLLPLSRRAVVAARRTGRMRALLTATYLARRPGLDRIFALLVIAVALCGYALLASGTASRARTDRSTLEVGPTKVLTVAPVTPLRLLSAVRAADPSGHYAMAATQSTDVTSERVLAVDSSRLGAVLPPGPGGDGASLATVLHPAPAADIHVTGTGVQLDLNETHGPTGAPVYVLARMAGSAGPVTAVFGPLRPGIHSYRATITGCTATRPCNLLGFQVSAAPKASTAVGVTPGTTVVLSGFRQATPDREILTTAGFGAVTRWRTTTSATGMGPTLTATPAGLSIAVPATDYSKALALDATAYLVSAPVPAPVVQAGTGDPPDTPGDVTVSPFGFGSIPVRQAAPVHLLPRFERAGMIVDLGYALDLAGTDVGGQISEVWLAPGTPAAVMRALAKQGLTTTGVQTIASRADTYAREPGVVGERFQVVAGLIGVAVAAVALLLVGSVERRPRATELISLRRQGVTAKTAGAVAFMGYGLLAAGAVVAGLIGAVIDRLLVGNARLFRDGWHVLPRPSAIPILSFLILAVVAIIALGLAALFASMQLTRAVAAETTAVRGSGSDRRDG